MPVPKILADRRSLFAWVYAARAWGHARELMRVLAERGTAELTPEHQAFCFSIVTAYCRPFTRSDFGKILPKDIIPKRFLTLHDHMIRIRHEAAAHTDGDPAGAMYGEPLNAACLRVVQLRPGVIQQGITSTRFTLNKKALAMLAELIEELEKKASYYRMKIQKAYDRKIPTELGDYRLNVENDKDPMWIPIKHAAGWGLSEKASGKT